MLSQHTAVATRLQQQYGMYVLQRTEMRQGFNLRGRATVFSEPVTKDETRDVKPAIAVRRLLLPYNVVALDDGTEVLFNREYHPLWTRRNGGKSARVITPHPWRDCGTTWFYKDATPEPERVAAGRAACAAWGIALPDKLTDLIALV